MKVQQRQCCCVSCCRLRKAEKKKKKLHIHIKNPTKKKDLKKIMLKVLEEKLANEDTPLCLPLVTSSLPLAPISSRLT